MSRAGTRPRARRLAPGGSGRAGLAGVWSRNAAGPRAIQRSQWVSQGCQGGFGASAGASVDIVIGGRPRETGSSDLISRSDPKRRFMSRTPGYQLIVASTFVTWLLNLFEDFDDSLVALDNDVAEGASAR